MTYSALGIDTQTGERVKIHKASRLQGFHIIGLQGTGKTVLIKQLANQDSIQRIGFCVLDLHGDLTNDILSDLPPDREKDVIYLDLTDYRYPFGLNLFTCSDPSNPEIVSATASRVMHIFKKLWGKGGVVVEDAWGVTLEELLWNTTLTFLEASKDIVLTMAEIPLFLTDAAFRNRVVNRITNRHVKDYWLRRYNLLSERDQRDETRSTLNRVNAFLTQPIVEGIVGQARSTVDFRSVMDERKILLVKLSKRHEAVSALIGTMLIAEFLNAAYSRADLPVTKRKQFHIYADEAQNYQTEDFATLLEEGRKFAIGITFAHQNLGQIEYSLRERIRSVPNHAVFKVNSNDAAAIAGEYDYTPAPERLEEIEKEELIGQRAVLTYKRTIVNHLLHGQGHEDERVKAFVNRYLRELDFCSRMNIQHKTYIDIYPKNSLGVEFNPESIPPVLEELNGWLYEGMSKQSALWRPLPARAHAFLSYFFALIPDYAFVHYSFLYFNFPLNFWQNSIIAMREGYSDSASRELYTKGTLLAEEASYSGISRDKLVNASVAAHEAAFVDFLSSLFPGLAILSIREALRQSGFAAPSYTLSHRQNQAILARQRIAETILAEVEREPGLDAGMYTRSFLAELSKPRNAVAVFLPVLGDPFGSVLTFTTAHLWSHDHWGLKRDYREWRTVKEIVHPEKLVLETSMKWPIYGLNNWYHDRLQWVLSHEHYTYHLELFTENIRLGLVQEMQKCLEPFLAFLRFFASLHCAQLALCQDPIQTTDSGMYEQDKRTLTHYIMHAQRAYADMLNEVASELTNLPLYAARVRIMTEAGSEEHTIRTLDPKEHSNRPLFGQALQARLDRIRKQNMQDGYVRERAAVEEEIRQRQEQYREPPEEPPISRRPPR